MTELCPGLRSSPSPPLLVPDAVPLAGGPVDAEAARAAAQGSGVAPVYPTSMAVRGANGTRQAAPHVYSTRGRSAAK